MPRYDFMCNNCDTQHEISITLNKVTNCDTWDRVKCPDCNELMTRNYRTEVLTHNFKVERDILKPLNCGAHAEDWKKARAAKIEQAIANEPISSKREQQDIAGIASEYEKERNLPAGTVLGNVKGVSTKEDRAKIQKRDKAKADTSRAARRKSGV